jgi:N-methylhydantoinase A
VELRNLRLIAKVVGKRLQVKKIAAASEDASKALKRKRYCYFDNKQVETPVYDSEKLKAGNVIQGPAVIEVPTTTAIIPGNFQCKIDDYGNYIITRRK